MCRPMPERIPTGSKKVHIFQFFMLFTQKYRDIIANMDTSSVEETLNNQKFLEQETKQKILPVYHRSDLRE